MIPYFSDRFSVNVNAIKDMVRDMKEDGKTFGTFFDLLYIAQVDTILYLTRVKI